MASTAWLTVVVVAGCMTPVIPFGGGKTARQAQHDTMTELGPASLVPATSWTGEIATARIRVYADDDYRAQNLRWQQTFDNQLELANLVLGKVYGVKLVPEYRAWQHRGAGGQLGDDVEELAAFDPGRDVLVVIGLTSALPLVSATFDELGLAALGGRHLVVRGYADLEERKQYADVFRDLLPEERELALQARRQHKTAVVLLHELAHTLGVEHEAQDDTLMSAGYSHRASGFTPQARDLMLRALDQRLGRGVAAAPVVATPAVAGAPADKVAIQIGPDGKVDFDGKELTPTSVDTLLVAAQRRNKATEVLVRHARGGPTDALDWIVERSRALGLRVSVTEY